MNLNKKFPPLYSCSICDRAVKVIPQGIGVEPLYEYHKKCDHRGVTINANRKVMLKGKGNLNQLQEISYKVTLSLRQILSLLTGRSI